MKTKKITDSTRNQIYTDFLTGNYYLRELAAKHQVAIDTVHKVITKALKNNSHKDENR